MCKSGVPYPSRWSGRRAGRDKNLSWLYTGSGSLTCGLVLVLIRTEGWLRDDLHLGGRLEGEAWADYMGLTGGSVVVLVV
jgi:hypothetical protein